jgi:hypothetical protein
MPDWYFTVYTARMVAIIIEVKMSATSCDYIPPPTHYTRYFCCK